METSIRFFNVKNWENIIDIETFLHPISIDDNIGKEIVMHIDTNVFNDDVFFTDSNGLEMQKRKVNYRPTWDLSVDQSVAGNYYPITSMISL